MQNINYNGFKVEIVLPIIKNIYTYNMPYIYIYKKKLASLSKQKSTWSCIQ